ncbi:MAG: MarR family transcriptional regulator, partial [Bacteroidetes bacterium]|nr:MarR family transcriptional regulator [Bacteroidota bacterium]
MSRNGLNMEYVKSKNRSKFLRLLNNNEVMSRMDVASTLSLTRATVTNICSNMIEKGIIIEKGEMKEKKRAGRKKILIEINYKYKHVLGINIEPDFTYISISDLKGEIVICKKIKTISGGKPN